VKRSAAFVVGLAALGVLAWRAASTEAIAPDDLGAFVAAPVVQTSADGTSFTEISVLTYNVHAFPWPLRVDGAGAMEEIGRKLHALRAEGRGPDVLLIQEGFSDDARRIADIGGYPFHAEGSSRADSLRVGEAARGQTPVEDLIAGADWTKGETLGPLIGSGLRAFSRFPIAETAGSSFGRYACAGYDCLAGKGVLGVRIDVPGVPGGVAFFTTHLNANKRSGVSQTRSGQAYELQLARLKTFMGERLPSDVPVIFGGDFNIKNQKKRQAQAYELLADFAMVHHYCDANASTCRQDYHGERRSGWLEPRDVQGFRDGARVRVEPVSVEALFDGGDDGAMYSDHAGYLVKYRLTWMAPPRDDSLCL
jgi:hypothetical protein